jgi:hypothetical protein
MASGNIAGVAFARAWSVYLLINTRVDVNDERRATLERFIRKRCEAGTRDTELLVVEGLRHLKKLDESGAASQQ